MPPLSAEEKEGEEDGCLPPQHTGSFRHRQIRHSDTGHAFPDDHHHLHQPTRAATEGEEASAFLLQNQHDATVTRHR